MSGDGLFSAYSFCTKAAGNLFVFALFLSPMQVPPTFRRIIRSKSTELFSGSPRPTELLNMPLVWHAHRILRHNLNSLATANSVGAILQLAYIVIFIIIYAGKRRKVKMLGLLVAVFAAVVLVSLRVFEQPNRKLFVGYLTVFSLISMFASPLLVINTVIRTKSVECMPFNLSLATFLATICFFAYGMLKQDTFVSVPNGIGAILGITQLVLYFCYSTGSVEVSRQPLLESYV